MPEANPGRPPGPFGLQLAAEQDGATPQGVPPAVTGPNIVELSVPETARAGGTVVVTGRVHFNNLSRPITDTPVRVQARGEGFETVTDDLGGMSHCNERGFRLEVPAIGEPGEALSITVVSQSKPFLAYSDVETQGPFTVTILSAAGQATRNTLEFAPWAIAGSGVGVGAAALTDRPLTAGGVAGAGAGVGTKLIADQLRGDVIPKFPTVPVLAVAGLLGAGALFLGRIPGRAALDRALAG